MASFFTALDVAKRDAEIPVLSACTLEEAQAILELLRASFSAMSR